MSTADSSFTVGFKHLSPDAKKAGLAYGEAQREGVSGRELRVLLRSAAEAAPQVAYPLVPELRITAPSGRFMIQLKDGRLHFVSWSSAKSRGGNPTADQIFAIIAGEEVDDDTTAVATSALVANGGAAGLGRWILGGVLVMVIVGVNFYSIWNYRKPPGNLMPPYNSKEPEPAKRLVESVAGNYETGGNIGDRRLQISREGEVIWFKFGQDRSPLERKEFSVQGIVSNGQDALLNSKRSLMIKVKDPRSLTLYGDTYVRVPN